MESGVNSFGASGDVMNTWGARDGRWGKNVTMICVSVRAGRRGLSVITDTSASSARAACQWERRKER